MSDYSKFCVHRMPDGSATGYREYYERLAAQGHRLRVMTADTYGPVYEAWELGERHGVGVTAIYRPTSEGQQDKSKAWNFGQPYPFNVPGQNYTLDVEIAADNAIWAFEQHLATIPEWVPGTWFLFWNEIDHERLEYAAEIALRVARYAVEEDRRFAFFGLNAGEPEPEQWQAPHIQAFLEYAADHPDNVALALHEYSFSKDIENGKGYLLGRFVHLAAAFPRFDELRVFISECGHGKDEALQPANMSASLDFAASLYGDYPNIDLIAWWVDSADSTQWGGAGMSQDIVNAWGRAVSVAELQDPPPYPFDPLPAPPPDDRHTAIVLKLPQNFNVLEWIDSAMYAEAYRHTMTASHNDMLTMLQAGNDDSYVKFARPADDLEAVKLVEAAGYDWEDVELDIFGDITEPDPPIIDLPRWVLNVPALSQRNPQWEAHPLGQNTGHGLDIGAWGCLTVAYCSMAQYLGLTEDNPAAFNDYLVSRGAFYAQYIQPGALATAYPNNIKYDGYIERASDELGMIAKLYDYIDNGIPVPAEVDFRPETAAIRGPDQHWVLVCGYDNIGWLCMDPWTGEIIHVSDRYDVEGIDLIQCLFYTPIEREPVPPPAGAQIRTADYLFPAQMPSQYMMRDLNGSQERYRYWRDERGGVVLQKNGLAEYYEIMPSGDVALVWDTSPDAANFYVRSDKLGSQGRAVYAPAVATVGAFWGSPETHAVQFYNKANCEKSRPENSGGGLTQIFTVLERAEVWTTPEGVRFEDVIFVDTGLGELQVYARSLGRVGWVPREAGFSPAAYRTAEDVDQQTPYELDVPWCLWSIVGG